jgi:DNA-directed RNA polymerase specialized sigma24 family protein
VQARSTLQARLQQQADTGAEELSTEHPGGIIPDDKRQGIAKVQAEFSPRNWLIFWRVVVEERDTLDVATEFGVSSNVVRLAKSRILRRLRETMSSSSTDDEG